MGLSISKVLINFCRKKTARILMRSLEKTRLSKMFKKYLACFLVGLDSAGKTTILYKLKLGEIVNTMPTIGFNVETVVFKNIQFTVWDV